MSKIGVEIDESGLKISEEAATPRRISQNVSRRLTVEPFPAKGVLPPCLQAAQPRMSGENQCPAIIMDDLIPPECRSKEYHRLKELFEGSDVQELKIRKTYKRTIQLGNQEFPEWLTTFASKATCNCSPKDTDECECLKLPSSVFGSSNAQACSCRNRDCVKSEEPPQLTDKYVTKISIEIDSSDDLLTICKDPECSKSKAPQHLKKSSYSQIPERTSKSTEASRNLINETSRAFKCTKNRECLTSNKSEFTEIPEKQELPQLTSNPSITIISEEPFYEPELEKPSRGYYCKDRECLKSVVAGLPEKPEEQEPLNKSASSQIPDDVLSKGTESNDLEIVNITPGSYKCKDRECLTLKESSKNPEEGKSSRGASLISPDRTDSSRRSSTKSTEQSSSRKSSTKSIERVHSRESRHPSRRSSSKSAEEADAKDTEELSSRKSSLRSSEDAEPSSRKSSTKSVEDAELSSRKASTKTAQSDSKFESVTPGGYKCKDRECLKAKVEGLPKKPEEKQSDELLKEPSSNKSSDETETNLADLQKSIEQIPKLSSDLGNSTPLGYKCKDRECLKSQIEQPQSNSAQIPKDSFAKYLEPLTLPPNYKCKDHECLKSNSRKIEQQEALQPVRSSYSSKIPLKTSSKDIQINTSQKSIKSSSNLNSAIKRGCKCKDLGPKEEGFARTSRSNSGRKISPTSSFMSGIISKPSSNTETVTPSQNRASLKEMESEQQEVPEPSGSAIHTSSEETETKDLGLEKSIEQILKAATLSGCKCKTLTSLKSIQTKENNIQELPKLDPNPVIEETSSNQNPEDTNLAKSNESISKSSMNLEPTTPHKCKCKESKKLIEPLATKPDFEGSTIQTSSSEIPEEAGSKEAQPPLKESSIKDTEEPVSEDTQVLSTKSSEEIGIKESSRKSSKKSEEEPVPEDAQPSSRKSSTKSAEEPVSGDSQPSSRKSSTKSVEEPVSGDSQPSSRKSSTKALEKTLDLEPAPPHKCKCSTGLEETSSQDTYASATGKSLLCAPSCGDVATQTPTSSNALADKRDLKDIENEDTLSTEKVIEESEQQEATQSISAIESSSCTKIPDKIKTDTESNRLHERGKCCKCKDIEEVISDIIEQDNEKVSSSLNSNPASTDNITQESELPDIETISSDQIESDTNNNAAELNSDLEPIRNPSCKVGKNCCRCKSEEELMEEAYPETIEQGGKSEEKPIEEAFPETTEQGDTPQLIRKSVQLISKSASDHIKNLRSLSDITEETSSHTSYLSALGKSMCAPDCGDEETQTSAPEPFSSNNNLESMEKCVETTHSVETETQTRSSIHVSQETTTQDQVRNSVKLMCAPDCGSTLTQTPSGDVLEEASIRDTELGALGKSVELMCAPDCGDTVTQTSSSADVSEETSIHPTELENCMESMCAPDCGDSTTQTISSSNVSKVTSIQDTELGVSGKSIELMCAPDCGVTVIQTSFSNHLPEESQNAVGKSVELLCDCAENASNDTDLSALYSITCSSSNIPKENVCQPLTSPKEEVDNESPKSTAPCIDSCPKKCYETSTTIRNLSENKQGSDGVACEITVKVFVTLKPPESKSGQNVSSTKGGCTCSTVPPGEGNKDQKEETPEEDINSNPFLNEQHVEQVLHAERIDRNYVFDFRRNPFFNSPETSGLEEESTKTQQNEFLNQSGEQNFYLCTEDIQQNPFACKRSYMKIEEEKTCNVQQNLVLNTYSERRSSVHIEINSKNPFYSRNSDLEDEKATTSTQQNPFLGKLSEECLYIASNPKVDLKKNTNVKVEERKRSKVYETPCLEQKSYQSPSLDKYGGQNTESLNYYNEEGTNNGKIVSKNNESIPGCDTENPSSCSWVNRLLSFVGVQSDEKPRNSCCKSEQIHSRNPFLDESIEETKPKQTERNPVFSQNLQMNLQKPCRNFNLPSHSEDDESSFANPHQFCDRKLDYLVNNSRPKTCPKVPKRTNKHQKNFALKDLESELTKTKTDSNLNRPTLEGIVAHLGGLLPEQFSIQDEPEKEIFQIKSDPERSSSVESILSTFEALNQIGSIKRKLCEELEKKLQLRKD